MKYILMIFLTLNVVLADDLQDGLKALENDNFELAVEYFEKSANCGNDIAQHNLAVMYNNGYGVKRDTDKSSKWIEKAVKNNSEHSTGKYSIEELTRFANYSEKYSKHIPPKSVSRSKNSFVLID